MGSLFSFVAAYFRVFGDNELTLVSTKDDPGKFRMGVRRLTHWGRSLGCFSWNSVRPDDTEDEVALMQGKIDDRFPLSELAGELRLDLKAPGENTDAAMREIFVMFHDGVHFKVPIFAPNLGGGAPGRVTRFYTDHGRFCINWQDDTGQPTGIVYATQGSVDEARWSAVGKVRIDPIT